MLVAQAEDQFEWWTGRRPAAGLMHEAAMARLAIATDTDTSSQSVASGNSVASGFSRTRSDL